MGTPLIRTRLEDLAVDYRELGSGNLESDPDYWENQSAVKRRYIMSSKKHLNS